jgi:hypothetical protein
VPSKENAARPISVDVIQNARLSPVPAHIKRERETLIQQCRPHLHEIIRAVKRWSPEYIALTSPFISCTLIGPAAMNLGTLKGFGNFEQSDDVYMEMLRLTLDHFAKYWNIGSLLLGKHLSSP